MSNATNSRNAYVPDGATWGRVTPSDAGLDAAKLQAAVAFAEASESPWPRSFYYSDGRYVGIVEWNETGPWSEVVGPVVPRGGPAGMILRGGRIVAEWGDTARPDMTFSVAKSYLERLTPESGVRRDIDDNGDLLVRRMGKVDVERHALESRLAQPSWLDPESGGPRK